MVPVTAAVNSEFVDQLLSQLGGDTHLLSIGGSPTPAATGETYRVVDPATGDEIAEVALAGPDDAAASVATARDAHRNGLWLDIDPAARESILLAVADLIEAELETLAVTEVLDNGMPLGLARGVVKAAAATFRYYAGWPTKIEGSVIASSSAHHRYVAREPVGVCALIIPWNFPLSMAAMKLAPCLAAGNTCVLKPAVQTPLTALRLASILTRAGVPEGVVSVLPGGAAVGSALVDHPDVDMVSFTGSTPVGRQILEASSKTLKRVNLELGGKSANIVLADADLASAARYVAEAIFTNSGQVCTAGSRLVVEEKVHDEFVDRVTGAAARLTVGPGLDPATDLGPLISAEQLTRVRAHIEQAASDGAATAWVTEILPEKGFYVGPTVFTDVEPGMKLAQEEVFGPVLAVMSAPDFDSAIEIANDSVYGLAAAVWTRDLELAHRSIRRLETGTVFVNCYHESGGLTPFGGYKQSGIGREQGRSGLDQYLRDKSVVMRVSPR